MSTKFIQSAVYRTKIKRMVQLLKSCRPLLKRLPSPLPRPGSEAFPAPKIFDNKMREARQAAFDKAEMGRLDKSAAPFWLESLTFDETRRNRANA